MRGRVVCGVMWSVSCASYGGVSACVVRVVVM